MKRKIFVTMACTLLVGMVIGLAANWILSLVHRPKDQIPAAQEVLSVETGRDEETEHNDYEVRHTVQLTEEEMSEFGIEVSQADKGGLQIEIVLPGEIVPNADELAHIVPRVSGIAREVKKKLGDSVRKGDIMAVIESRELADVKARYLAALERVKLSQAKFTREEKLWKGKVSSEQDYLDAKQVLAETTIQLRTAEQKLHALGFSNEYLQKLPSLPDESYTMYEILAPFDGTIIKKHITLGEVITSESEIYEIVDLTSVWINLTVYQKDLSYVDVGQNVVIRAPQVAIEAIGVIDYISPIVEESTRTATARVVLANPDGRWRPGIFITGIVRIREVEVSLLVPSSALQRIDDQNVVFVLTEEGFSPQPVKIGRSNREYVEILSGLEAGQVYVTTNAFTIKAELSKGSFGGEDSH